MHKLSNLFHEIKIFFMNIRLKNKKINKEIDDVMHQSKDNDEEKLKNLINDLIDNHEKENQN